MDMQTNCNTMQNKEHCDSKCISWGAIIAGAFVGVGLAFLLHMLSMASGWTAFNSTQDGMVTLAAGGFIGMLIGVIITMFFSGWVAGYLARKHCHHHCMGGLYGFVTWCLTLMLAMFLVMNMGKFMVMNVHHVAANNAAVMSAVINKEVGMMEETSMMTQANANNPQAAMDTATDTLRKVMWVSFILFLVGALASTIGGCCGVKCRKSCGSNG